MSEAKFISKSFLGLTVLGLMQVAGAMWADEARAECNIIVKAAIQIKGNNNSFVGQPVKDFTPFSGVDGGCLREYQNGVIYASNKTGAWIVNGAILSRYKTLGGPTGFLGVPMSDESATPDGYGRYNHFAGGSIYWHPCIGAYEVHGLIRNLWASMSWEKSALGYPKSNETPTLDGQGRYSDFQGGRVVWHPTHGTFVVSGAILRQWADQGYEKGPMGYPVAGQVCRAYGRMPCTQKFQNGVIAEDWNTVDLRGEIGRRGIAVRNQADRPTCSVHAMTFLLEYAYTSYCGNHYQNLSEEYSNHVANLASGRTDDGDFFSNILAGYNQYGIVTETQLPYQASYDYAHFNLSDSLIQMGKYHIRPFAKMTGNWIREYAPTPGLTNEQMSQIITSVRNGIPVAIGRSHSLVIVGYEKGNQYPGGGRFIIRNSYGPNAGGTIQGYQFEDFKSVQDTVYDVITMTR